MVVSQILKKKDIECPHIRSANELLGLKGCAPQLSKYQPDVILLDIVMPEMDGIELLQRLRNRDTVANVPVVMLSASHARHDLDRALQAGASGFVPKPVDPDRLIAELSRIAKKFKLHDLGRKLSGDLGSLRVTSSAQDGLKIGIVDLNYLMEIMDNDTMMVQGLVQSVVTMLPEQLEACRDAVEKQNAIDIRKAAHALKGAIGNLGAPNITDHAYELERQGAENRLAESQQTYQLLVPQVKEIIENLQQWLKTASTV